jgi:hypothetical protein
MENFAQYIHIAQELGLTPLNLVLAAMLYFIGAHSGIFPKFYGETKDDTLPATRAQMDKLSSYYNHDTTEILKSIDANVVKVHESVTEVFKAVDKLDDAVKELKIHQQEIKEYGVKVRK